MNNEPLKVFRPEDFEKLWPSSGTLQNYADAANARLAEYLEGCPKVYGFVDDSKKSLRDIEWDADDFMHTHTARLVDVKRIGDE